MSLSSTARSYWDHSGMRFSIPLLLLPQTMYVCILVFSILCVSLQYFFLSFIIISSKLNIYSKLLFHFWRFIWIYLIFFYFRFLIFCVFSSIFFLSTNYIFAERLLHTGRTAANFCQQTCKAKNMLLLNKSLILRI